jgi:circadian clock protein KaiC
MIERDHVKLVVIDSLNGYYHAMPGEKYMQLQVHELFSYLNQQGIITITILAQQGLIGPMQSQIDLSYVADTVILLRFFEAGGEVRQAISIVKKRSGKHERTIREFKIDKNGVRVGSPLRQFHGILAGIPTFTGSTKKMLKRTSKS